MGESYMYVFPADPLQPKPDWPKLRGQLLQRGFITNPSERPIADAASDLWWDIVSDRLPGARRDFRNWCDLNGLLEGLKEIDLVPADFSPDCGALGLPAFVSLLKERGLLSSGFSFPEFEFFRPGPLYWQFSSMPPSNASWARDIRIEYSDSGDQIQVAVGEGLFEPPGIPGTDRVCPDWKELLDRWYLDPTQKWIDPETAKGYGILDLDWDHTLGAGRCWLQIQSPGYLDGDSAAALLTELTGQEFAYSRQFI